MGYRTYFTVSTTELDEQRHQAIMAMLSSVSSYSIDVLEGCNDINWYNQDEDCLEVSRQFPDVVLRVQGVGDQPGDLWVAWYQNGKSVHYSPPISIPDAAEPPRWDAPELQQDRCWVGVQNSGRRWYFDTQAELDAEQARGGQFVRTYSMTEDLR